MVDNITPPILTTTTPVVKYKNFSEWLVGSPVAFYIIVSLIVLTVLLVLYLIFKDKLKPKQQHHQGGGYEPQEFYIKGQFGAIKLIFWVLIIITAIIIIARFLSIGKLFQ
jgi:Na+/H+ antiporter NhaC